MGRLTRKQESTSPVDASDVYSDPYAYPPGSNSTTALPVGVGNYNTASTDAFIGRDQAIPGGRRVANGNNTTTYPPYNDDFGYEKGSNPVTRGSIAAQVSA